MATDKTPPRNRLIGTIALITLCSLVAVRFIVTSYFDQMIDADRQGKISKPEELWAVRAEQQKNLESSPKPIGQAMKDLESTRADLIAPKQSDDTGPLVGWSRAPKTLPKPAVTIDNAPAPMPSSDAGTNATDASAQKGDGGADGGKPIHTTATTDGGKAP